MGQQTIIIQIYVVDSSDDNRIKECNDQLKELLTNPKLNNVPLVVFANKQDLQTCLSPDEVIDIVSTFLAHY